MSNQNESVEEQVLRAVTTNQAAVVEAVRRWAETVEKIVPELPTPPRPESVPDPAELVDRAFGFATALLAAQREFTHDLLAAAAPAVPGPKADAPAAGGSKKAGRKVES
jgi:hypothetical protein